MPQTQTGIVNAVQLNDTANTPLATVVRDTDGSISVGQVKSVGTKNSGGAIAAPVNYTTTQTLDGTVTNVTVDGAGGVFTVTLPPAATSTGYVYNIARKTTANNVTIKGNAAELILSSGAAANTLVLTAQGQQVSLFCDGAQWYSK